MKPDIRIRSSACLLGALALLLIPLRWLFAVILAAAVHEGGHLVALKMLGVRVTGISIGFGGASIETAPMSGREELLSAMAGPVAGFLLLPLARWIPCTALCAAVQSLYNLLPMGHQDGSRILRCVLGMFQGRKATVICKTVETILMILLAFFGVAGSIRLHLGYLPMILCLGICAKTVLRKIPCKSGC